MIQEGYRVSDMNFNSSYDPCILTTTSNQELWPEYRPPIEPLKPLKTFKNLYSDSFGTFKNLYFTNLRLWKNLYFDFGLLGGLIVVMINCIYAIIDNVSRIVTDPIDRESPEHCSLFHLTRFVAVKFVQIRL